MPIYEEPGRPLPQIPMGELKKPIRVEIVPVPSSETSIGIVNHKISSNCQTAESGSSTSPSCEMGNYITCSNSESSKTGSSDLISACEMGIYAIMTNSNPTEELGRTYSSPTCQMGNYKTANV